MTFSRQTPNAVQRATLLGVPAAFDRPTVGFFVDWLDGWGVHQPPEMTRIVKWPLAMWRAWLSCSAGMTLVSFSGEPTDISFGAQSLS
ncbi:MULTISPECIES: hypothetical protein [unclassified Burkholderia]|uniref:hypothetical protein n=1 Tax=unclassified Burkholderia TaxID=2613784 RepID=UPI0010931829|nr:MULTISPECIES: hypothetical protein [unclassified Burkholderia]TGN94602.1 hypothetical protein PL79_027785 [Burkholderia sp. USMB20]